MNKTIKIILGLVIIALVVWGIYSFSQRSQNPVSDQPIKIGVITGLTGEYAFVGENWKKGVMLAEELYKKANPNSFIELIIEDDGFDTKKGLSAYRKMVDINKIDALINMTTPTINAIYNIVVENGMPVIQGGEQSQEPVDDNIMQIMPGNIFSEIQLGEYVKDMKLENLAVVYNNDATFLRFFDAFKNGYNGSFDEYKLGSIESGTSDYRTITTKILAKKPSAIVFITIPNDGARLISEILKLSTEKPQFIFDLNFQSGFNDYKQILGDMNILNGDITMMIASQVSDQFIADWKAKYNEEPGVFADWAYDAYNLLLKTYDPDNSQWVKNLKKVDFEGVSGKVTFDETGVRIPDFQIKTITNGAI